MRNTGTVEDPIDIEEEQEYQNNLIAQNQKIEKENVEKILRFPLDSKFQVAKATIMSELPGSIQQRQATLHKRVEKFFKQKDETINLENENEHLRERREPNYSLKGSYPISSQLLMFGIDFCSVKQIRSLFHNLKPQIKTVDDSHYKIIFKSKEQAKQGLQLNLLNRQSIKIQEGNEEFPIPRNWFQLQPYYYKNFKRRLWVRYLANYENDEFIKQSNLDYKMKKAKKQFEQSLNMQDKEIKKLDLMNQLPSLSNRNHQRHRGDRDRDRRVYQRENDRRRWNNYQNRIYNNRREDNRSNRSNSQSSKRSRQKNRQQNSLDLSVYSSPKSHKNSDSKRVSSEQNFEALLDNSYEFQDYNMKDISMISMNDSFGRVKEEEKNNEHSFSMNRSMKKNMQRIQPIEIED